MKQQYLLILVFTALSLNSFAQFPQTAQNWTVPVMENSPADLDVISNGNYTLVDINGDGKPDLVDAQDNANIAVWLTGSNVPYWKVYLSNGTSFNTTAQNWTIPAMENNPTSLDQINAAHYSLVDINGDGKPDLVDAQDNATGVVWITGSNVPYWKVYLNNGTSFSTTAQNWTIPVMQNYTDDLDQVNSTNYSLVDINGDGKPDLVDAQDNATGVVWVTGSNVPYWKVFLNSGTSFSTTAQNWTIPVMQTYTDELDQVNAAHYSLVDINGDGKPDLVDAQDNATEVVWVTGSNVPYWKVFLNSGTSFSTTAQNWSIPVMQTYTDELDQVYNTHYSLLDMNGDHIPDLVDAQDNATALVWLTGSNVPYWKVYLNESVVSTVSIEEQFKTNQNLAVYPNPTNSSVTIDLPSDNESQIQILNSAGIVIYKDVISDKTNFSFDLSEYETGLYFITVINNDQFYNTKVIKE